MGIRNELINFRLDFIGFYPILKIIQDIHVLKTKNGLHNTELDNLLSVMYKSNAQDTFLCKCLCDISARGTPFSRIFPLVGS